MLAASTWNATPGSEMTDHEPSLVITLARCPTFRVPPRMTIVAFGQVLGSFGS